MVRSQDPDMSASGNEIEDNKRERGKGYTGGSDKGHAGETVIVNAEIGDFLRGEIESWKGD